MNRTERFPGALQFIAGMDCLIGFIVLGMGIQSLIYNGPKSIYGWISFLIAIFFAYLLIALGRDTFKRRPKFGTYNIWNSSIGIAFLVYTSTDFVIQKRWVPAIIDWIFICYFLWSIIYLFKYQIKKEVE